MGRWIAARINGFGGRGLRITFVRYVWGGLFLLLGGACTEIIDVDLGSMDSILVVDAKLTTDTTSHQVKLNRSCDYYDPDVDRTAVVGAEVYVLREDGSRIDYLEDLGSVSNSVSGLSPQTS